MNARVIVGCGLGVWATFVWSAEQSAADPLTFAFAGHIDYVRNGLGLDESVVLGAPFSGSYRFDPAGVKDFYPDNPRVGFYPFGSAGWLSVSVGNYDFRANDLGMLIWNDIPDVYQVSNQSSFEAGGLQWTDLSLLLVDEARSVLDSDALYDLVPDLDAFGDFRGLILATPGGNLAIRGLVTSLTPEPGPLVLLALGATLIFRRGGC